jgi:methionine biosynthesis protein MetW
LGGRMPRTDNLPDTWHDTPNIHFCTIKDFRDLTEIIGAKMVKAVALNAWGSPLRLNAPWWFWNLFGEQAVFLLSRKNGSQGSPASVNASPSATSPARMTSA